MNAANNSAERPFAAVLSSILGNLQDIIRSEIKLAKAQVSDDLAALKYGCAWLATGLISVFFAIAFVLGAAFLALQQVMPSWTAALVMAGALAVIAATTLSIYRRSAKAIGNTRT